jgi:hypothetical protein
MMETKSANLRKLSPLASENGSCREKILCGHINDCQKLKTHSVVLVNSLNYAQVLVIP